MILQQLLVLYIFIFLGWLLGRIKPEIIGGSKVLSFLLVNLFLPSKVFSTFSQSFTVTYLKENYTTFFISLGILVSLSLLAIPLSAMLTKETYKKKVYRYSFVITNYGYMGYALIESFFGKSALANMITFCIPFAIYTYTVGYMLLTGEGKIVKKLFNTMTVSIVLGCVFGLVGIPIPSVFVTVLSTASACTGPLSMLLTGLVIASFKPKELLPDGGTLAFVGLRLIALPALVFGVCKLLSLVFTLPAAVYPFAVIVASMPCGLNTVVFPRLVGEDCRMGARMILYSHIFSMATIPLWMMILI
ncbi:MAG: hypothetical protein E7653_08430 [Ruminococcaceae bacterium]|nr:hypothetical protein [Oscillospiraceae bacterium]